MSQRHKKNEETMRQQSGTELRYSAGGDQKVIKEIESRPPHLPFSGSLKRQSSNRCHQAGDGATPQNPRQRQKSRQAALHITIQSLPLPPGRCFFPDQDSQSRRPTYSPLGPLGGSPPLPGETCQVTAGA